MKPKSQKKYRVKVGNKYCSLKTQFDPLGTVHPDAADAASAHVFNSSMMANNCIARVETARKAVREGLYPDHPLFKALFFSGRPEVEEFLVEAK